MKSFKSFTGFFLGRSSLYVNLELNSILALWFHKEVQDVNLALPPLWKQTFMRCAKFCWNQFSSSKENFSLYLRYNYNFPKVKILILTNINSLYPKISCTKFIANCHVVLPLPVFSQFCYCLPLERNPNHHLNTKLLLPLLMDALY